MAAENISCTFEEGGDRLMCNGTLYILPEKKLTYHDEWFWIYLGIYVGLVLFAGLMSGLTMGLLSLDMMSLNVLKEAGTPKQKRHAKRIVPIVKRHHLLLVTLLLANAAAVESMPLFLDKVSDPITAICVSVTAVLLFGEVFPQALCTRFGLAIGATLAPLVYFLMALLFIIAYPISKLLDCMLGHDHATFFRRAELKALVDLHGPGTEEEQEHASDSRLTVDEVLIIKGALEMKDKTVKDAMVPLESVFMLDINENMDRETMDKILQATHSRVPVYSQSREKVKGVLLVKMLLNLDPDDATPVADLVQDAQCCKKVNYVFDNMPLFDILNEFQSGKTHLTMVRRMPYSPTGSMNYAGKNLLTVPPVEQPDGEIIGIITLEDVIEELLQEEIIDETDVYVDVHKRVKVARAKSKTYRSISSQDAILQRSTSAPHPPLTRVCDNNSGVPRHVQESSRRSSGSYDDIDDDGPKTPLLSDQS